MNDPMTILKADHREVKKLLTALGDSEEGLPDVLIIATVPKQRDDSGIQVVSSHAPHISPTERVVLPAEGLSELPGSFNVSQRDPLGSPES